MVKEAKHIATTIDESGKKFDMYKYEKEKKGERKIHFFITPHKFKKIISRGTLISSGQTAYLSTFETKKEFRTRGFNQMVQGFLTQESNLRSHKKQILETKIRQQQMYEKQGWKKIFPVSKSEIVMEKSTLKPWKNVKAIKTTLKKKRRKK